MAAWDPGWFKPDEKTGKADEEALQQYLDQPDADVTSTVWAVTSVSLPA